MRGVRPFVAALLATSGVLVAGCDSVGPIACTDELIHGIRIEVTDASTGQPVMTGLSGVLSEGSYREDMQAWDNELLGAAERAGRYAAAVAATGYRAWVEDGILVEADACHVKAVRREARLVRL